MTDAIMLRIAGEEVTIALPLNSSTTRDAMVAVAALCGRLEAGVNTSRDKI